MNDRRCIVTRESRERDELIRFVAAPDGRVVADLKNRLPGRGAWVTAEREAVRKAIGKRMFARALGAAVTVDEDLAEAVGALLAGRALAALGLAARAGAVVTGHVRVEREARAGRLGLVLHAADGSPDGRRKIDGAVQASGRPVPIFTLFGAEQLSLALGQPNVVHAGAAAGRVAASLEAAVRRYERYCGGAQGAHAA